MATVVVPFTCASCGATPKKVRNRKDGEPALPFRWVRNEEGDAICPDCKPKVDAFNWNYHARPPHENREEVERQMLAVHRYRNALVALERLRRERSLEAIRRVEPRLPELDARLEAATKALEDARERIKEANKAARRRTATPEQRAEIKRLSEARRALYDRWKAVRAPAYAHPDVVAVGARFEGERKRLRAECGAHWGSYLRIEAAANSFRRGPPPEFRRHDHWPGLGLDEAGRLGIRLANGHGRIGVQLQGGLSVAGALACRDKRFRLERTDRARRGGVPVYVAWLRIGTVEGQQDPVWCKARVVLHRPLPPDATIKEVLLKRDRVATRERWGLTVTMTTPAGSSVRGRPDDRAETGAVGLDLGWRQRPDGGLRVAYWFGSDGRHGELVLPPTLAGRWGHASQVQGTSTDRFNEARESLTQWLLANPHPQWLKDATQYLPQWKSEGRLAGLVRAWGRQRFDGDGQILEHLTRWLHRHHVHYYEWQMNEQRKAQAARLDLYRRLAAWLRRQYHTVVMEDVNWREEFQRKPNPEDGDTGSLARTAGRVASVGTLQQQMRNSFARVIDADPQYTTQRCHACGRMDGFDAARELVRTCRHCGARADQDCRAAVNLLAADGVAVRDVDPSLEVPFRQLLVLLGYTDNAFRGERQASMSRPQKREYRRRRDNPRPPG